MTPWCGLPLVRPVGHAGNEQGISLLTELFGYTGERQDGWTGHSEQMSIGTSVIYRGPEQHTKCGCHAHAEVVAAGFKYPRVNWHVHYIPEAFSHYAVDLSERTGLVAGEPVRLGIQTEGAAETVMENIYNSPFVLKSDQSKNDLYAHTVTLHAAMEEVKRPEEERFERR
jgi:hypothetical protein